MKFFGLLIRYLYFFMNGNIGNAVTEDTCLKPYGYIGLKVLWAGILLKIQIKSQGKMNDGSY